MKSLPLKLLAFVGVIAALSLGIAPKIIGLNIEQTTIDSVLELFPPEAESQLEVRRREFNAGWFSSSASIEVLYSPLGTDAITLSMDFNIAHGPLLRTRDGLVFGAAYATIVPSVRDERLDLAIADLEIPLPQLSIDLLARLDQSLAIVLHVGPTQYSGTDGTLNFAGLEARVDVSGEQAANISLEMGKLSALEVAANSNVIIEGMTLISSTARMNDILAESNASFAIPSISSTAPLPFTITGIETLWGLEASTLSAESSDVYQTLNVAQIESEIPLNSLRWTSEVKRIRNELIQDYYKLLSEIQSESDLAQGDEAAELDLLGQELLLLTLNNSLEINNDIEFSSYQGSHSIVLRANWAGLERLNSVDEIDMSAAIAALDASLVISLDLEAILRSPAASLVDPYAQQGYLTLNNGRIMVEASLQESVLRVNGDQLPLEQFF